MASNVNLFRPYIAKYELVAKLDFNSGVVRGTLSFNSLNNITIPIHISFSVIPFQDLVDRFQKQPIFPLLSNYYGTQQQTNIVYEDKHFIILVTTNTDFGPISSKYHLNSEFNGHIKKWLFDMFEYFAKSMKSDLLSNLDFTPLNNFINSIPDK